MTRSNSSPAPASSVAPPETPDSSIASASKSRSIPSRSACSLDTSPRQLALPMFATHETSEAPTPFSAGSPAKISASPAREPASEARSLGCGPSLLASSASLALASSSSRTPAADGSGGCPSCGAISTPSGIPACRFSCPPQRSGLPTIAFDASSLQLPTPTASAYGSCQGGAAGREGQRKPLSLPAMARRGMLPTPTVEGNRNRATYAGRSGDGLRTRVNADGGASGPLAPSFLEWMMGWPMGYSLPIDGFESPAKSSAATASSTRSLSPSAKPRRRSSRDAKGAE